MGRFNSSIDATVPGAKQQQQPAALFGGGLGAPATQPIDGSTGSNFGVLGLS